MRVALVTREYPPETAWGGIGVFYSVFAAALARAGHDVEVFTPALALEGVATKHALLSHIRFGADVISARALTASWANPDYAADERRSA